LFRVISLNANGIRAAARKGFFDWMARQNADVVCIQETKAQAHQLTDEIFSPEGYHCFYEDAEKKGYSGTAIYSRHKPKKVIHGYGDAEFDNEGRYLEVQLDGVSIVSLYLPSGSSKEERQIAKYRCMDSFTEHLNKLKRRRSEYIICGDWNIVHKEADIRNWKQNQKNSGCLPEERPGDRTGARAVHMVVESRACVGQQCRVAHRLSRRDARARRQGSAHGNLPGRALFRPRAADHGLRLGAWQLMV
jgi:exodeoxyribonuclease-3